jgi:hypothetical protein
MEKHLKKKRFASAVIVFVACFGLPALASGADQIQSKVIVISHEWFKNPPASPSACFHLQASNESINEILERDGHLCFINQQPKSYSQGGCPLQTSDEAEKGSPTGADEYAYRISIRNSGQKAINTILWDYVFSDPETGKELARHTFSSESTLSPGRTKTITATSAKPPTRVISARMLLNNWEGNYVERIEIKAIRYADGSMWKTN